MSWHPKRQHIDFNENTYANLLPDGQFAPADFGWISWNYDPTLLTNNAVAPTAGKTVFVAVPIRRKSIITKVLLDVGAAGSGLTSGQCFAGLFNSAGVLLSATADQSTSWNSAGLKTMALSSPQPVPPGIVFVGFFANGTTLPTFQYTAFANAFIAASSPLTAGRCPVDSTHTGLTTAFHSPATFSAGTQFVWAGVS